MGSVHSVSSEGVTTSEKISRWNSGSAEIGGVQAASLGSAFKATASVRRVDDLLIFGLQSSPHQVSAQFTAPAGQGGSLRLRYQRTGRSVIQQAGTRTVMSAGEWHLFDPAYPHIITNEVEASHIFLQLPVSRLSESEARIARSCRGTIPHAGRVSGMLFECLRMTIEELGETSTRLDRDLSHSMIEMFRLVLGEAEGEREQRSSRELIQERVRDHIRRNLYDSSLSVETIAKAIGCSPRYIHKTFAGSESVSQYIWSQRLEHCRRCLALDSGRTRTLTELAFDHGFSSSAHFSRKFREQFGFTPSMYRQVISDDDGLQSGEGTQTAA